MDFFYCVVFWNPVEDNPPTKGNLSGHTPWHWTRPRAGVRGKPVECIMKGWGHPLHFLSQKLSSSVIQSQVLIEPVCQSDMLGAILGAVSGSLKVQVFHGAAWRDRQQGDDNQGGEGLCTGPRGGRWGQTPLRSGGRLTADLYSCMFKLSFCIVLWPVG